MKQSKMRQNDLCKQYKHKITDDLSSMTLHLVTANSLITHIYPSTTYVTTNHLTGRQRGFTLVEVMVALAILAVVAVAASQASGTYLKSVENLKTRTLAHFVAQNTAANLQINPQWIQSPQKNKVSSQGRDWEVSITPVAINDALVSKSNSNPYSSLQEYILPLSIQVAPVSLLNGEVQYSITDLDVMISNAEKINEE